MDEQEWAPYLSVYNPFSTVGADAQSVLMLTAEFASPVPPSADYSGAESQHLWLEMPIDNDDARAGAIDPMSGFRVPASGLVTDFKGRRVSRRFEVEDPGR